MFQIAPPWQSAMQYQFPNLLHISMALSPLFNFALNLLYNDTTYRYSTSTQPLKVFYYSYIKFKNTNTDLHHTAPHYLLQQLRLCVLLAWPQLKVLEVWGWSVLSWSCSCTLDMLAQVLPESTNSLNKREQRLSAKKNLFPVTSELWLFGYFRLKTT